MRVIIHYPAHAGPSRHGDALDNIIYNYTDVAFRSEFRMNRDVFWKLAQLLEERGAERGANTWHQGIGPGYEPRPIYQQIAAALLVLSDNGSSRERHRIHMDLGRGSVTNFVNRTITVLDSLVSTVA